MQETIVDQTERKENASEIILFFFWNFSTFPHLLMHNVSTIMLTEMLTSISRRERPCSCWRQTPPFLQRGEWRPQLYRPWYTLRRCRLYHLDRDVQSLLSLTALSVNGTLIGWRWAAMVTPRLAWNHGRVVNGVNPGSSYALKWAIMERHLNVTN